MTVALVGPTKGPLGLPGGLLAGYSITAAGVVTIGPSFMARLACQSAGSITLNDCSTTGSAAITNQVISVSMSAGQVIVLNWPCATGIVASAASGTFALSFS